MATSVQSVESAHRAVDLPTIDMSLFSGPNATPASKRAVVDQIHRAATDHGELLILFFGVVTMSFGAIY